MVQCVNISVGENEVSLDRIVTSRWGLSTHNNKVSSGYGIIFYPTNEKFKNVVYIDRGSVNELLNRYKEWYYDKEYVGIKVFSISENRINSGDATLDCYLQLMFNEWSFEKNYHFSSSPRSKE